jgi:magnesium transporter
MEIEKKVILDSKPSNLDDILKEKLEQAYHKETSNISLNKISKIAAEHSPIDLAYAVAHLPPYVRPVLYDNLPSMDGKILFILNTDTDTRVKIFRYMKDREIKELFEKMPSDEAVWVSEDMSDRRFKRIMGLMELKKSKKIKEQRKHKRNSAGRLMSNEFFAFSMNMSIKKAAAFIRDNPNIDFTRGVFILNEKKELQGHVPTRNLLINSSNVSLKQIMRPIVYKVSPESSREEVVDIVERYKVSFLPVVDEHNRLMGIIDNEDVIEVMEDIADEKIAKITGTSEKMSAADPLLKRFFRRSPWLIVTLFAGLVNMMIMSSFQKYERGLLTFVLFFVPLITGMSGNIGIQCSTVLVRSIAIEMFSLKKKDAVFKELLTGVFTGVVFGLFCGGVVYLMNLLLVGGSVSPVAVGVIVGVGLIGACFAGTFLGVFSPLFFARLGIDPAISAGPIVTAFNDILSMTIYFLISWGLGSLFFP